MFLYETFVISQKTIYMRHIHLLLAGFLLCICCTLQAKNRVIDQPAFIVRNTTSIEVSKVVISDTATVLHIYAKYRTMLPPSTSPKAKRWKTDSASGEYN